MVFNKFIPDEPFSWIKSNSEKFGIFLMRLLMAAVWLSQGMAKVIVRSPESYGDHNGFLGNLVSMRDSNPLSFVVAYLDNIIIPNHEIFLVLVITTELFIGFSLALGLFTRIGSLTGGLMTIQLWLLTLGWGEWIWTYPLIFMPHLVIFLSHTGRDIGIDRFLVSKWDFLKKFS